MPAVRRRAHRNPTRYPRGVYHPLWTEDGVQLFRGEGAVADAETAGVRLSRGLQAALRLADAHGWFVRLALHPAPAPALEITVSNFGTEASAGVERALREAGMQPIKFGRIVSYHRRDALARANPADRAVRGIVARLAKYDVKLPLSLAVALGELPKGSVQLQVGHGPGSARRPSAQRGTRPALQLFVAVPARKPASQLERELARFARERGLT